MELKPGTKLTSGVDSPEVIVVPAPSGEADLRRFGAAMVPPDGVPSGGAEGSRSLGNIALPLKDAKPLPPSERR